MLACLYLTANVFLRCGMLEQSREAFVTLLNHIEQLWDSSEDFNSASPFEVELHQQLLALAESTNDIEEIEKHKQKLKLYQEVFGDGVDTLPDTVGKLSTTMIEPYPLQLSYSNNFWCLTAWVELL